MVTGDAADVGGVGPGQGTHAAESKDHLILGDGDGGKDFGDRPTQVRGFVLVAIAASGIGTAMSVEPMSTRPSIG